MTLWSSPHPKESTALSLGQVQQQTGDPSKIKELGDHGSVMPSSATSFGSDGSEDAGFEDGSIDVDMGEEETEGIQIDCIQTLTEFEPIAEGDLGGSGDSPLMADYKTAIPLPAGPSVHIGSAYGGNQAYGNIQNGLHGIMDRPASPMSVYWNSNSTETRNTSRVPGDVGLNNIGNTCFMNSGLQCLLHTSPLAMFFVGSDSFEKTSTSLIYQFHSLMKHAWFGNTGAISLHDFKLVLGNKYAQFKDCRQHDCQEFLAVLLDMLHEELKSKQKVDKSSVADSSVTESYIEDCTLAKPDTADQSVVSTSKNYASSAQPDTNEDQASNAVSKKSKLGNNTACVTECVNTYNDQNCEVVKRKSAKQESGVSASNEAVDCTNNVGVENEAERSGNDIERSNPELSPVQKAQLYWNNYMRENNTVIASTFQGMFKSSVTCSECGKASETYEPFMYLSLPIPRVMEKHLNVTFISMKDRSVSKTELTLHVMGTVDKLIQEVVRKMEPSVSNEHAKYAAAEIGNHRVVRVLNEKLQLRNLSTNPRNIYVYELNDNFDDKYGHGAHLTASSFKSYRGAEVSSGSTVTKTKLHEDWETDESASIQVSADVSTSSTSHFGTPKGGGVYDSSSIFGQSVSSSSDSPEQPENENFNKFQCNICLEDFSKSELKQHRGCSCILCEACLLKSVEHFKTSDEAVADKTKDYVKCAVCLLTVECKIAFISLEGSTASSSPLEYITIPVIFRNEPDTDANNNSPRNSGLFGHPWLLRVPSYMNAFDLVEYLESINPIPEANHRLLSVKSDGKTCGQCVFSSRCNGCEIPREGMISLNSCNSILISYTDLTAERVSALQPADMAFYNELTSQRLSRNEEPTIDIHDCLRTFSETEHLDEQNPWFCPRCNKHQSATKTLSICKFPDYLIVYLKRFVFIDHTSNKLDNRLTFPINDLDVSAYVTEGFGSNLGKYNLYSCVCHFGGANSGHYTAFAKNPVTTQWHYFNDCTITQRAPADSEYSYAYVLFYEKQGMSCNMPSKCNRPLPDLNSFNTISASSFAADTRGSYLPGDSLPSGPVRVDGDFMNEMNLQVDSTSPNFSFPHASTESDLVGFEDEGVGKEFETNQLIVEDLGVSENDLVVTSTSAAEDDIQDDFDNVNLSTQHHELSSSGIGGADSTSN